MSTLAYASLTTRRDLAPPPAPANPASMSTWVDSMASMVPTEVLAVHAAMLSLTTTTKIQDGVSVTLISDRPTLIAVFWALIALSMLLYAGARVTSKSWDRFDFLRIFIAPLAFVGWAMMQKSTAFDAVFPELASAPRTAIAIFGAILLGLLSTVLANVADQNVPPSAVVAEPPVAEEMPTSSGQ